MRVRNVPSVLKLPRTEPSYRGGARPLPSSGQQPLPVWLDCRRILRPARSRIIPPQGPKIRKFIVSLSESFRRGTRWWRIRPARNQREGRPGAAERKYKRKRYMADEKIIFSMVGVSKTFTNQKRVLNNIYLSFFYGAKIGIIGLNGSGKSTLMKIIAGIDKKDRKSTRLNSSHITPSRMPSSA